MVAGTHSGVGKTTIATGLMAGFTEGGRRTRSAKVGPDYIDPGFHAVATGQPGRNLDPWICGPEAIGPLAGRAGHGGDLLVVEGVMGLFDGAVDGAPSSTAEVARLLDAPVVLVVDGSSMSGSVAALVRGFRDHDPRVELAGVILNRVGSAAHRQLLEEALATIDVEVFGALGRDDRLSWRERHLGLVPVAEDPNGVAEGIERLAELVAEGCDLDRLERVARAAPSRTVEPPPLPERVGAARIAVAGGRAFTFVYRDNQEALQAAGAELVPFDPLHDPALPTDIDGVFVGGGFPETFVDQLGDNEPLCASMAAALAAGLPTWAECGGLLWLAAALDGRPMLGAVEAEASMSERLTLGYRTAEVLQANPVAPIGARLRGHEFHYSTVAPGGDALRFESRFGTRTEGFASPTLLATYLHQHLGGDPTPATTFVQACRSTHQPVAPDNS